ncbi:hypothetical protein [Streptomyces sp. NBC_00878]|uniref:hypothetical protein n=1 Tax=Streptomyces sp. NBC_00878 TaxID=2975854 RepID=UPI00225488EE|nr:hypothetical protein [Streptomyces sp. NBC_00878]MCX4911837.1 hypothetical protein [Streptomyces sp. NBC_00878]
MTTETVYRLRCDGPHCPTTVLTENLKDAPEGWRVVKSTDHIPVPPPQPAYQRGRRTNTLSYAEQCRGSFTLHLCPDHTTVFDAHLPRTDGLHARAGRDPNAYVSCSCGMPYVLSGTGFRLAAADMSGPAAYTEKQWWRHLPTELKWYAERKPA